MKVVYVAGAFRGATPWDVHRNVIAAEAAGLEVAKLGAMPLIPHKNTEHYDKLLPDSFWLDGTAELLRRSDALYLFDPRDLNRSAGTRAEVLLAGELGIPVFDDLVTLAAWLGAPR